MKRFIAWLTEPVPFEKCCNDFAAAAGIGMLLGTVVVPLAAWLL